PGLAPHGGSGLHGLHGLRQLLLARLQRHAQLHDALVQQRQMLLVAGGGEAGGSTALEQAAPGVDAPGVTLLAGPAQLVACLVAACFGLGLFATATLQLPVPAARAPFAHALERLQGTPRVASAHVPIPPRRPTHSSNTASSCLPWRNKCLIASMRAM